MDADYADDLVFLANAPVQAESLLQTTRSVNLSVKSDKTEFMYLGSSISSTDSDENIIIGKVWTAIHKEIWSL